MAQLMQLPLTVSCFNKIRIGFTFLVPADPGSPVSCFLFHFSVLLLATLYDHMFMYVGLFVHSNSAVVFHVFMIHVDQLVVFYE